MKNQVHHLSTLLKNSYDFPLPPKADRMILGLTLDSREIQKNYLFFALKGKQVDGRLFINEAISKGVAAVLLDVENCAGLEEQAIEWRYDTPIIPIHQLTKKMGDIAAQFYGSPSQALLTMGVTGTSGKTSCTHFLAQSLDALNISCGIIGTLGYGFYGTSFTETGHTTPDALKLQNILHDFIKQKAKAIAMEVSSHSIHQERINAIKFDIGIFTNLSQDHLDYHGDMQTYAAVKQQFLAAMNTKNIIINADDHYGSQWIHTLYQKKCVAAYGLCKPKPHSLPADLPFVLASDIKANLQGIKASIYSPWGEGSLALPLIGTFNLSNSLAVLTALCMSGFTFQQALYGLSHLQPVRGRMQMLGGHQQPLVVVDYAHKPDALEKVLQALRAHTQGRLICVFGCGGERDSGKRPIMAKIAERCSDQIIITNDNPRHEKPEEIVADIVQGFSAKAHFSIELDRSKAIKNSIQWATSNDCVLIAGKGAEHYQQIGDINYPFDDVEKVKEYLVLRQINFSE